MYKDIELGRTHSREYGRRLARQKAVSLLETFTKPQLTDCYLRGMLNHPKQYLEEIAPGPWKFVRPERSLLVDAEYISFPRPKNWVCRADILQIFYDAGRVPASTHYVRRGD